MSNLSVNTITDASGGSTASINGLTPQASNMQPFNRIINGAMTIDQRNAGAAVTANDGTYPVDRFRFTMSASGKGTAQQQSSIVPVGFSSALRFTSSAATTLGATDFYCLEQYIESNNLADMAFGTVDEKTFTISFKVYSSLTGTFSGSVQNGDSTRSYPFTYTISSASTWALISVTIAGDQSGTWLPTTNGTGMKVCFSLGVGSSRSGTAGAWTGGWYPAATGATSVVGTSGATFYITGVQLESGSAASSFAHEDIWTTEQKCRRYYEKSYNIATVAGSSNTLDQAIGLGIYTNNPAAYNRFGMVYFKAPKRANPTITLYAPATGSSTASANATAGDGATNIGYCTANQAHQNGFNIAATIGGQTATNYYTGFFAYTAISEL